MYSKQRLTLFGHLETFAKDKADSKQLQDCYLSYHPDAKHFIPGSDSPHLALWTTFIVDRVYRVGGYGDESQIGWLDMERWQRAGRKSEKEWLKEWRTVSMTRQQPGEDISQEYVSSHIDSDRLATLFADNDGDTIGSNEQDSSFFVQT